MFGWAVGEWRDGGSPFFVFQFTTAMCEGVCCVSEPFFASPPPNSGKPGNKKWGGGRLPWRIEGGREKNPFLLILSSCPATSVCRRPSSLSISRSAESLPAYNIPGLPIRIHPFSKVTKTSKSLLLPIVKKSVAFFTRRSEVFHFCGNRSVENVSNFLSLPPCTKEVGMSHKTFRV